jgi:hypothetical protein
MASQSCIAGNVSFGATNDGPAITNAEHNWWGAPSGPNTPGADAVGANVDASNYLTPQAPICNPWMLGRSHGSPGTVHTHGAERGRLSGRFHLLAQ